MAFRVGPVLRWMVAGIAILVVLAVGAVFTVANTDRGREWVRGLVVPPVNEAIHGRLEIDRIEGNLLLAPRLVGARLVDAEGRPFIEAERVTVGYSLFDVLRKRIILTRLELEGAHVVLDEVPGQDWNFVRIFDTGPDPDPEPDPGPGWGDWMEIRDVRLVAGRLTLRTAWEPDEELPPAEREVQRQRARAGETTEWVVEVPEGLQQLMDFQALEGEAPRILVAHPDTADVSIEIARLSTMANVFRTPPVLVEDLSGQLRIGEDTVAFHDVEVALPATRLAAQGWFELDSGGALVTVRAEPLTLADLRFATEALPAGVSGDLQLALRLGDGTTHVAVDGIDVRIGAEGRLEGRAEVTFGELFRIEETRLRFAGIDTRFLEEVVPELELARHGTLDGHFEAAPAGAPVDGVHPVALDLAVDYDDEETGTSRVLAEGVLLPAPGDDLRFTELTIRVDPLEAVVVRAFAPDIPLRGTLEGFVTVDGPATGPLRLESAVVHRDPTAGTSRVTALGGVDMRDELRLLDLVVGLEGVRLDLAREYLEQVPSASTLSGFVRLDGPPAGMLELDSELLVDEPATGISRIVARGGVAPTRGPAFRDFEVRVDSLALPVIELLAGELPVGGFVDARARLDGDPDERLAFEAEVLHRDETDTVPGGEPEDPQAEPAPERIHLVAGGAFTTAGDGYATAEVDVRELSLRTAGRFAPEARLRGQARGRIRVEGSPGDLEIDATWLLPDEGAIETVARVDLTGDEPDYELAVDVARLNLAALSGRIDETTAIEGRLEAAGRGLDPETLRAGLRADLVDREAPDERALRADVEVEQGLLRADALHLRAFATEAHASGSFGLRPGVEGELRYMVLVDSLQALSPFFPTPGPDPVEPRPAVHHEAVEARQRELFEAARAAEVEYLATGRRPGLPGAQDTLALTGIRRDALAGTVAASGTVRGHVERVDVEGDLVLDDVLAMGHRVGHARIDHTLVGLGEPDPVATLELEAGDLLLAGFGYERLSLDAAYRGRDLVTNAVADDEAPAARHRADVFLDLRQDDRTEIRTTLDFDVVGDGREGEVVLADLAFAVPGARYVQPHPAVVRWAGDRVEVRDFRLESDVDARVLVHGSLPRDEAGGLEIAIEELELAHVLHLLQGSDGFRGRLQLAAQGDGTLGEPVFDAEAGLSLVSLNGNLLPEIRARLAYAARELTAEAFVVARTGETMLRADARLPLDLAVVDPEEPRLRDEPMHVEARIDDLSLESIAALTDQLESVIGRIDGHFALSGTFEAPELEGRLALDAPTMFVVPLGVRLADVAGALDFRDDVLSVDSIVAWSRGPVRLAGQVRLPWLEEPEFDLTIEATDTRVINTDDVQMRVDADIAIAGPLEAIEITGEVRPRRGVIRIPETEELAAPGPLDLEDPAIFERVDARLVAARDALIDPAPFLENLRLDLAVHIARDVWIRSTEMNVELFTPPEIGPLNVRMQGVSARGLTLEGTVSTDRGEYDFMGRRFAIARGSVTFGGGPDLNPVIRLTAEHEVQMPAREAFDIRIILEGTVADLETALESTSQPPLSQTDLLSFLVFGRDAGSLLQQQGSSVWGQGTAGGPLVGAVAARAAQQFASVGFHAVVTEVEAETARALGLDVLRIQPADLPAEVSTGELVDVLRGTEVEAGAYLTPRLFVSGQARPTFVHPGARIDYLTDHGWTWRATWRPRYLPAVPTLSEEAPDRASVLGALFFREWRF